MNLFRTFLIQMAQDYIPTPPPQPEPPAPVITDYVLDQAAVILDALKNNGTNYNPLATTWVDLSGNQNDFTVANVAWSKKCEMTPNSSQCYGPSMTHGQNITMEICCEIDESIGTYDEKPLIADFSVNGGSIGIQNFFYTGGIGMTYCDENNNFHDYNMIQDNDFVQGQRYTFTITMDAQGNINGYINAIKVLDIANQSPLPSSSLVYKAFGRESGCTLSGSIYSIRIYDKVLSLSEIENNYIVDQQYASLPVEYQQVAYIQSTGTQYIDTGLSCSGGIKCLFKANYQVGGYLCGSHNTGSPYGRCGANIVNNSWELGYGESFNQYGTFSLNTDYDVEYQTYYSNAYLKVKGGDYSDWATLITGNSETVSSNNALIFANQYAITYGEPLTEAKLYSLQIWDSNNALQRNFVPCYRKSDGEIGLYDLINNAFYTNDGTGTFLAGPDIFVLPDAYQQVEYIESGGGQYIDTGIVPLTSKIEYILSTEGTTYAADGFLIGNDGQGYMGLNLYNDQTDNCWKNYQPNGDTHLNNSFNLNTKYDMDLVLENGDVTGNINNSPITQSTYGYNDNYTVYLFRTHFSSAYFYCGKLFKMDIYQDDAKIRQFIPCYRKSDNEIGLYDLVNDQFYTNLGTGTFTKGSDI